MAIAQRLLPEVDNEMAMTRRLLDVVPEDRAAWKPHPKSMSLGALAAHIANLPVFMVSAMTGTEFDPVDRPDDRNSFPVWVDRATTLARFDALVAQGREALRTTADDEVMTPWTFKRGGVVRMTLPRLGAVRMLCLNHIIHHRGQLSVYLRLNDVPLPNIYGPNADNPV